MFHPLVALAQNVSPENAVRLMGRAATSMALVILQDPDRWTLPLGLMSFQSQFARDYGQLNAAIVMTVLPAAIVYLIFQRYFVSGLTSGAVKE